MKISHHWLLPAAVLVASIAPLAAPLLADDPAPRCPAASAACAPTLARR